MAKRAPRRSDDLPVEQVRQALARYESQHPDSTVEVYRQNSVSIRARIIDPDFAGIGRGDCHEAVWRFLEGLPEEVQSQVTMLLLLTPEETGLSLANFDFDHPIPSKL